MKWKHPHIIKIYEALGTLADDRIEVIGNTARVYSSSRNKFYEVSFDLKNNSIMSNDNGSYWNGELGYPATACLLKIGLLKFDPRMADLLKGVKWKDINQSFKNDFDKTLAFVESTITDYERHLLVSYVNELDDKIRGLNLSLLGEKIIPPKGY
ncbi:MAG: hypothetical protein UZ19_OD1000689 [Parcubacteria bacterium OLB19]|nr:MAG: hypothetical protein UZ19_OD1000689 [Parcubacteria bacterium OLB19]